MEWRCFGISGSLNLRLRVLRTSKFSNFVHSIFRVSSNFRVDSKFHNKFCKVSLSVDLQVKFMWSEIRPPIFANLQDIWKFGKFRNREISRFRIFGIFRILPFRNFEISVSEYSPNSFKFSQTFQFVFSIFLNSTDKTNLNKNSKFSKYI